LGLSYERAFGKALPRQAKLGPWFEFEDMDGPGFCQPDAILSVRNGPILVFECKLSDTPAGRAQLDELYLPVVRKAFGREAEGVVVTKHLKPGSTQIATSLREIFSAAWPCPTLHWRGAPLL